MVCVTCQKKTTNPKFCSRSCAARHNNRAHPKRKKTPTVCCGCGLSFFCSLSKNQFHCSAACKIKTRHKKIQNAGRFDIDGTPAGPTVRKYIETITGNFCAVCNQSGKNWCGKKLTLIVDHVDGDARNWAIKNIRLVCPNCDSQLPTFKGRNKGRSTRKYTIIQK